MTDNSIRQQWKNLLVCDSVHAGIFLLFFFFRFRTYLYRIPPPYSVSCTCVRRASAAFAAPLTDSTLNGTRFKKTETCSLPLLDFDPLGTAVLKFSLNSHHTRCLPPPPSSRSSSTMTSSAKCSKSTTKPSSSTRTTSAPGSSWTSVR